MYSSIETVSNCPLTQLCCKTQRDYSYTILKTISIEDQIWMESREPHKYRLIATLLTQNESYRLIKIMKHHSILLYHFIQTDRLSVHQLDVSNWIKKLFGWYSIRVLHAAWTPLYDLDLCIWDKNQINLSEKTLIEGKSLLRIAHKIGASVTSFPVSKEVDPQALRKIGFRQPYPDFSMQLSIPNHWVNFDSYLADLKKKYRKRAVDIRSKGTDLVYTTLGYDDIVQQQGQLYTLYNELISKQKFNIGRITPHHFADLKLAFADSFQLEAIYHKDTMCGFISYFIVDKQIQVHYIGLNYVANNELAIYFNILFRVIEIAIQGSYSSIDYGRTSLDAKASAGAVPAPKTLQVKTSGIASLVQCFVLAQFAKLEDEQWKVRQAFKN